VVTAILFVLLKRVLYAAQQSSAHQPFEYMVAGTCVTAVALLAAFLVLVKRGWR
jgi:hypothetical protein